MGILCHLTQDDFCQEFWLTIFKKLKKYDPNRSCLNTYINRIIESRTKELLRFYSQQMRNNKKETSLNNEKYKKYFNNIRDNTNILEVVCQNEQDKFMRSFVKKTSHLSNSKAKRIHICTLSK